MGMLVLKRYEDERVIIKTPSGELIKVMIVKTDRNSVKVGFEADRDVTIDREEVYERRVKQ